jgi:hypothetical protein
MHRAATPGRDKTQYDSSYIFQQYFISPFNIYITITSKLTDLATILYKIFVL